MVMHAKLPAGEGPAGLGGDPRRGLPSASQARANALCPGRHLASVNLAEPPSSPEARFGTLVHLAMAGAPIPVEEWTPEHQTILESAQRLEKEIIETWARAQNRETDCTLIREKRLRSYDHQGNPLYSGQPDLVVVTKDPPRALVVNLKTGWARPDEPGLNLQLADEAALVWCNYNVMEVTVAISQPRHQWQPKTHYYSEADCLKLVDNMVARAQRSMTVGQPRIAGPDQCEYCRARATCPAGIREMSALVKTAEADGNWDLLPPRHKLWLWDRANLAEALVKRIKEAVKADLLKDGKSIPGLVMRTGNPELTIADAAGARDWLLLRARQLGADPAVFGPEIDKEFKLSLESAIDLVRRLTAWSERMARDEIEKQGFADHRPGKQYIRKEKE